MIQRPRPVPTALSRGFWEAAAREELAIQRCQSCRLWFHPPVSICTQCYSDSLSFEPVSGAGTLYSYTVMADDLDPRFADAVPLPVVVVELDEQPGLVLVSNLIGTEAGDVEIGTRCSVVFEEFDPIGMLPQFRVMDGTSA